MAEDRAREVSSDGTAPNGGEHADEAPSESSLRPAVPAPGAPGSAGPASGPETARRQRILRRLLPAVVAAVFAAIPFLIMCTERQFRFSVPVGFMALLVSAWGILDAMGTFDGDPAQVTLYTPARVLLRRTGEFAVSVTALFVVLSLIVAGVVPKPLATEAILVPAVFFACVVTFYRLGRAFGAWQDEDGVNRGIFARHGFWLIALNVLMYLPFLGSYSLTDPWEAHYGEVAREMLARDDWISTWWAQDGWFWSKPVLDFWIQAMDFSLLGVKYQPDQMLGGATRGLHPQPEWAARMPVFLLTLVGVYALYRAVAKVFGRRTGFIAGLVLSTMPYWFLIGHQTMTDMPYVGPLTASMSLLLLGFVTDPEQRLKLTEVRIGGRTFRISAMHLALGAVIVSTLPQVLYLASRDLTLYLKPGMMGFRFHADAFFAGSGGGNCGLPGNQNCTSDHPVYSQLWPITAGLIWTAVAGVFLYIERREQRVQRVYFLGAWYFLALSTMGKGAPGLVLPIVTALGFVTVARRWRALPRLELAAMGLLVACIALPWYVQMFVRHGPPFIDRLIMHDMYKRAFEHVHDTNQGDDTSFRYYVWQLGYGLFPWTGIAAGGLLWWLRGGDRSRDQRGDAASLLMVWFLATFGMFTITLTKFHHYILPLVPATAALTGIVVDRMLGDRLPVKDGKLARYLGGATAAALLFLLGVARLFPRHFGGEVITGAPPWKGWAYCLILLGVGAAIATVRQFGQRTPTSEEDPVKRYDAAMLALIGLASAVVVFLVGRDLFGGAPGSSTPGQLRLMNLFTYNYTRPWPDTLDYTGPLVAFTVLGVLLSLGLAVKRLRPHALLLFFATSVLFTTWGLDVYLRKSAAHWGQRETTLAYYRDRTNANQPFVAYQMNWKGENFYTSNHVPAFVSSGQRFKDWVDQQKAHGIHRVYFITETARIGSLKRELGDPRTFTEITDKALNNKFIVARVEY